MPGDWNSQHKSLFWYRGIIWYQKEFDSRPPTGKRVFFYFGGANFAKDVYVNGVMLARHKGGFTPLFSFSLLSAMRKCKEWLVNFVLCDYRPGASSGLFLSRY